MKFKEDQEEDLEFSFGENNDSDELEKLEDIPNKNKTINVVNITEI